MGDLAIRMPGQHDAPAGETSQDDPVAAFIESRKDLQLEVALGRKLLELYSTQVARVLARITVLFDQTRDGCVSEGSAIADARTLVTTADALEAAARGWMDERVRPIVDRHCTIVPPAQGNHALVQGWGDGFYSLVRAEYDGITDCLDGIHAATDRSHDLRAAIARCVIREVGTDRAVEKLPAKSAA